MKYRASTPLRYASEGFEPFTLWEVHEDRIIEHEIYVFGHLDHTSSWLPTFLEYSLLEIYSERAHRPPSHRLYLGPA